MNVLIEYCFDHDSARKIYGYISRSLRRHGVKADVTLSIKLDDRDLSSYRFLISHDFLDDRVRQLPSLRCYGGRKLTRPQGLATIEEAGIPVMPWALAHDRDQVLALFDRWQTPRVLLKKSSTFKGRGVCAFDRPSVDRLRWDPQHDVFCPDLSEDDGDVYKAEIFNGRIIISWVSRSPPLRDGFDGFKSGIKGVFGKRRPYRLPRRLRQAICSLSTVLTQQGIGYCSLDLMKSDGELVAIEINTGQVATWWSGRFLRVRWRYAQAIRSLIEKIERGRDRVVT